MKSFFNFFSRLFENNSSTSKKNQRRNHRVSRIEALEDRDMLSVSPWDSFDNEKTAPPVNYNAAEYDLVAAPTKSAAPEMQAAAAPAGYNEYEWNLVESYGMVLHAEWENGRLVKVFAGATDLGSSLNFSDCPFLREVSFDDCRLDSLDVSGCTNLQTLFLDVRVLTSLNVSECTKLQTLDLFTYLTSLDLSDCINLEYLQFHTALTSLDVSGMTSLQTLHCYGLTSLNVFGCTNLKELYCSNNNELSSLDVSSCIRLEILDCGNLTLTSLNASGLTNLQELTCGANQLTSLDVSGCTNLKTFYFDSYSLTSLNVSGCTSLDALDGFTLGKLISLNVSGCTNLKALECYNNQLTSLDVSGCTNLVRLDCDINQLTSLDVSGCTNLVHLNCFGNQLVSLNISGCTNLQEMYCANNQFTSLNLSGYTNLVRLDCGFSSLLTSLDVSGCTGLQNLSCPDTALKLLNAAGCTSLEYVYCRNSQLTSVNVSGCTNLVALNCCLNTQLTLLNLNDSGFAGYTKVERYRAPGFTGVYNYVYTYSDGTTREVTADAATQIIIDDVTPLESFSVVKPRYDEAEGSVSITWSDLGSNHIYRVSKAGRFVGDFTATAFEDINLPAAGIETYTVTAINTVTGKRSNQITAVAWATVRALDNIQIVALPGNQIQLKWTAQSDMTYTVYRAGRIVSESNFSGGEWVDKSPSSTNLYQITARYRDEDGRTWRRTYSNTFTVTPQPFASPASSRDEFWTQYGQTQEDLLTLDM